MHCTTTGAHKDTRHQKPCCKVVSTVHILTGPQLLLLKVRCNVGWTSKGSHKTWDLRHGVVLKFDFHAGVLFNKSIRKSSAWCLRYGVHQRHLGCLCVLTVGGEPLHATYLCPQANSSGPRRMRNWLHQGDCPKSLVSGTVLCGIAFPISTLSLPKIAPFCHWDTQQ